MVGTMGGRMQTATQSGGVYAQVEDVAIPNDALAAVPVHDVITEFLRSKSGQGFLQLYASIHSRQVFGPTKHRVVPSRIVPRIR